MKSPVNRDAEEGYRTLIAEARFETKVRRSRFIATASPADSAEKADAFIAGIRQEWSDATHNCFAYRCDALTYRFSDDGEPKGSAGKPILAAIDQAGLREVVIVVTRYFGGTRLGIGGLARAYGEVAAGVLAHAQTGQRFPTAPLTASFPHGHIGAVMHVVSRLGVRIADTRYDEEVHLTLEVRLSGLDEVRRSLTECTSGNILLK